MKLLGRYVYKKCDFNVEFRLEKTLEKKLFIEIFFLTCHLQLIGLLVWITDQFGSRFVFLKRDKNTTRYILPISRCIASSQHPVRVTKHCRFFWEVYLGVSALVKLSGDWWVPSVSITQINPKHWAGPWEVTQRKRDGGKIGEWDCQK